MSLPAWCVVVVGLGAVGCHAEEAARRADASMPDAGTTAEDPTWDAGVDPALARCHALEQDCPAGQKCTSVRFDFDHPWPPTVCGNENADSPAGEGDVCFGLPGEDTCGPGLACFNQGTGEGTCAKLCDPRDDAPGCGPDHVCVLLSARPAFALCMLRCDEARPCASPNIFECVASDAGSYCDLRWRDGF